MPEERLESPTVPVGGISSPCGLAERAMSRDFKITLAAIGGLVLMAVVICSVLPPRVRSSRLDIYLCDRCAIERKVIRRWWLGIRVGGGDIIKTNCLSREMVAAIKTECMHQWIRTYFDFHGTRVMAHGDVNSGFAVFFLTETEEGAEGLVKFSRLAELPAQDVWRTMFYYLRNASPGETTPFERWLFDENPRDSDAIVSWLRNNFDSIKSDKKKSSAESQPTEGTVG